MFFFVSTNYKLIPSKFTDVYMRMKLKSNFTVYDLACLIMIV